jgi:Mlc titration factor MtfA (ptsG expression regulator)
MFGWLQERHRRQILEHPFPESWNAILERNVAHWKCLDDAERVHLRSLVQVFVAEKQWDGCGGLKLTDEIQVTIAGLACLLLLGLDHMLYSNVKTICVYPSTVVAPGQRSVDSYGITMQEAGVPIYGQSILNGPVVLVWDAVLGGARHPERGHNVVYHEFAHKLDMLDGCINGTPPLADRTRYRRWVEVCTREYNVLRRCASKGKRTLVDTYGATNPGEFFAVITECFFDKPLQMKRQHLELYSLLQEFYRQDPAAREARHSHGFPTAHATGESPRA